VEEALSSRKKHHTSILFLFVSKTFTFTFTSSSSVYRSQKGVSSDIIIDIIIIIIISRIDPQTEDDDE